MQFSYALHERARFEDVGPLTRLARFSWWKGSRPAVFTYIKSDTDEARHGGARDRISQAFIDVDWFRVTSQH